MVASLALILAVAAPPQSPTASLASYLDGLAEKNFRGVVYIEQQGKEKFFHAVGAPDPDVKRPFTRDTGIEIGSIVKPIVRVALIRLARQGKLSLDDSIAKYFDNVPEDKKPITLRLLMDHKGGFKDVFGRDYQPMERDVLMKLMLASGLIFKPGEKDEYSNSGYSMLATIVEKVSGQPIEEHIRKTQFDPIGIGKTGYILGRWRKEDLPVGYDRYGQRWGSPRDHFWYPDGPSWNLRGNGGMISTVTELARWSRAVADAELLTKDDLKTFNARLFAEATLPDRFSVSAGGNGIFNTILCYNPARKLIVVASSNDGRFAIESVLAELLKRAREVAGA